MRVQSLVYEGSGSFHYSPTFSLGIRLLLTSLPKATYFLFGIRSPLVAAVVQAAVQVILKMNNMDSIRMVVILMPREPPVVGGAGWKSTWWPR